MTKLVQPSREAIAKRVSRSAGHLQSALRDLQRGKAASDVAHQLHAVAAAITNAKVELVRTQMQAALRETDADNGTVSKLQVLARYL